MTRYRWRGPVQSLTLTHEGEDLAVTLAPGREVELPEDHPTVQCWLGAGTLEEVKEPRRGEPRRGGKQKKESGNA